MSDKWISDDEISNILGSQNEGEEANEELLEELLAGIPKKMTETESKKIEEEEEEEEIQKEAVEVKPLILENFSNHNSQNETLPIPGFETLIDLPLDIRVVLGSTEKTIEEILDLKVDSVVKLSKMAGELVDIFVGNQPIAKGEIVIIDEKFGVLINEILSPQERVKTAENKLKRQK